MQSKLILAVTLCTHLALAQMPQQQRAYLLEQAQKLASQKQFDRALEQVSRVIAADTADREAVFVRGLILAHRARSDRSDDRAQYFRDALTDMEDNADSTGSKLFAIGLARLWCAEYYNYNVYDSETALHHYRQALEYFTRAAQAGAPYIHTAPAYADQCRQAIDRILY